MSNKITFQFDDKLDYQLEAVSSVVRLFDGLPQNVGGIYEPITRVRKFTEGDPVRNIEITAGTRLLDNLRSVQLDNSLYPDNEILAGNNFTVEMETGTGKTYVYLRTILELHKEYGFKKFMIIVPSIAIRIGVMKSIEMLSEHFKALPYGIDLSRHSFVYDSANPRKISSSFVEANDLSICVMNIQAFNKDTNKIRTEDEYGQILWEDIKYIRPIVIIDEPQKIEGGKKAKSKSLQAIDAINPLFVLRYSATHKQMYNQVYKLNSYDAYKKELVKSITVKTVNGIIPKDHAYIRYLDHTPDLYARIEIFTQAQGRGVRFDTFKVRGNASIYDLSGGLPQYRDYRIQGDPHKLKPLSIATPTGFIELNIGHSTYEITENESIRVQIRLAIENHFKKQAEILRKGLSIKVLTLFFVDSVSKVRDNTAEDGRGEYLRIFDEEYENVTSGQKFKQMFDKFSQLSLLAAKPSEITKVREGYFAVDKNKNVVEVDGWDSNVSDEDTKVKAKSQEDIDRGIELILSKKDELISFNEPLSFIFSHSALREGWDNPNVFTICTLKNGGSEIAKKQEIGRGLCFPVDTKGVRCTDSAINELAVIANDNFAHFAESLQKDFNDSMGFKRDEVTYDILAVTLRDAGVPKDKITPKLIEKLKEELLVNGIIDTKNMLTKNVDKLLADIDFREPTLREHVTKIVEHLKESMTQKGSAKIDIKNGDNEPVINDRHSYVDEDDFHSIFKSLSEKLSKRTIYKLSLDKDDFINECIIEINEILRHRQIKNVYEVTTAGLTAEDSGRIGISEAKARNVDRHAIDDIRQRSDFELCNTILYHTSLPRMAIFRILLGIEKKILLSNQDILDLVTKRIKIKLNNAKAASISKYEVVGGYEFDEKVIFETDTIDENMLNAEKKRVYETKSANRRAVNQFYRVDSDGEYFFADSLDDDDNVLLYTKIKKGGFVIDTPYGNYSPDWAIVYKAMDGNIRLYFIAETKFGKEWSGLTDEEQNKIKCGRMHFKAIDKESADNVLFDWANSYDDFIEKAKGECNERASVN